MSVLFVHFGKPRARVVVGEDLFGGLASASQSLRAPLTHAQAVPPSTTVSKEDGSIPLDELEVRALESHSGGVHGQAKSFGGQHCGASGLIDEAPHRAAVSFPTARRTQFNSSLIES